MTREETRPAGADHPFVSVIIPVRDDTPRLLTCLDALERQIYPRSAFEVIVVDNGSSQPVSERLGERSGTRVVVETRVGSYAARNRGASVAAGEILAFTDSDCLPDAAWLERGVAELTKRPDRHVAGAIRVFPRDPGKPTAVELYEVLFAFPQQRFVEVFHFGATANLFVSRTHFDQVGGFRDELKSGGDYEFGTRLHAAGVPAIYCDHAAVDHPARHSWRHLREKIIRVTAGRTRLRELRGLPAESLVADPRYAWRSVRRLWGSSLSLRQKVGVQVVYVAAKGVSLMTERRWPGARE
jgi:GT2 family glycosyltransferase